MAAVVGLDVRELQLDGGLIVKVVLSSSPSGVKNLSGTIPGRATQAIQSSNNIVWVSGLAVVARIPHSREGFINALPDAVKFFVWNTVSRGSTVVKVLEVLVDLYFSCMLVAPIIQRGFSCGLESGCVESTCGFNKLRDVSDVIEP